MEPQTANEILTEIQELRQIQRERLTHETVLKDLAKKETDETKKKQIAAAFSETRSKRKEAEQRLGELQESLEKIARRQEEENLSKKKRQEEERKQEFLSRGPQQGQVFIDNGTQNFSTATAMAAKPIVLPLETKDDVQMEKIGKVERAKGSVYGHMVSASQAQTFQGGKQERQNQRAKRVLRARHIAVLPGFANYKSMNLDQRSAMSQRMEKEGKERAAMLKDWESKQYVSTDRSALENQFRSAVSDSALIYGKRDKDANWRATGGEGKFVPYQISNGILRGGMTGKARHVFVDGREGYAIPKQPAGDRRMLTKIRGIYKAPGEIARIISYPVGTFKPLTGRFFNEKIW